MHLVTGNTIVMPCLLNALFFMCHRNFLSSNVNNGTLGSGTSEGPMGTHSLECLSSNGNILITF